MGQSPPADPRSHGRDRVTAARPLVSVVVPVYRHQPYLRAALASILALEYKPLEIIIQDDASPDDAFDVIKQVVAAYTGPHTLHIGKNDSNLSMGNYNALMEKASGTYIVAAHDDDIQYPDRINRIVDAFLKHDVSMVTSNAIRITADGAVLGPDMAGAHDHRIDAEEFAATGWSHHVHGPALSWHRDVFDRFGPIDVDGTARASDWIIPYRAALLNGIHYLRKPTFSRRVHKDSRGAIGRNTDDNNIFMVEDASESATQLVYMLKTTDQALEHGIITAEKHRRLTGSIRDGIVRSAERIAKARNRLHMRKLRMTWISHAAGAITPSDVPNLGITDENAGIFTTGGALANLPRRLAGRHKIVKAIKGPPWYRVALRNPLQIRYWWTLRRLQQQLQSHDDHDG